MLNLHFVADPWKEVKEAMTRLNKVNLADRQQKLSMGARLQADIDWTLDLQLCWFVPLQNLG